MFQTGVFVSFLFALFFFLLCCAFTMLYSHRALAKVVQFLLNYLVLPKGSVVAFDGLYLALIGQRLFFKGLKFTTRRGVSVTCVDGHVTFNIRGYALWNGGGVCALRSYMCHAGLVGTRVEVFYDGVWRAAIVESVDTSNNHHSASVVSENVTRGGGPSLSSSFSPRSGGSGEKHHHRHITVKLVDNTHAPPRRLFGIFSGGARRAGGGASPIFTEGMALAVETRNVRLRVAPSKLKVHLNGLGASIFHNKGKYDADVERVLATVLPEEVKRARAAQAAAPSMRGEQQQLPQQQQQQQPSSHNLSPEELQQLREDQVSSANRLQSMMRFIGTIDCKLRASQIDIGSLDATHPYFLQFTFDRADVAYLLTAAKHDHVDPHRHVVEGSFTKVDLRWVPFDVRKSQTTQPATPAFHNNNNNNIPPSSADGGAYNHVPSQMHRLKERAQMMFFGPSFHAAPSQAEEMAEVPMPGTTSTYRGGGTESNASSAAGDIRPTLGVNPPPTSAAASRMSPSTGGELPSVIAQQYGVLIDGAMEGSLHCVYYWDAAGLSLDPAAINPRPEELPRMGLDLELAVRRVSYGPWSNYARAQLQAHFLPPLYDPLVLPSLVLGKPRPYVGLEMSVVFIEPCAVHIPFKWRTTTPAPPYGIRDSGQVGGVTVHFEAGATYVFRPTHVYPNPDVSPTSGVATPAGGHLPQASGRTSSSSASAVFGIAESYFRAKNVSIRTSLHSVRGLTTTLLDAADMQLHYDVLSQQLWHQRTEWNTIIQLHRSTMFYQAEHTTLFQALLADWNHVPQMYAGEPYRSSVFHNRDTAVSRFTPSLGLIEVFFHNGLDLHLNANPDNVTLADTDIASLEHNTFATVACESATVAYTLPSEVYLVSSHNENVQQFDVMLHGAQVSSSVPTTHPLLEFCQQHALRVDSLGVKGTYTVTTPDMSVEQQPSRLPTNSTPSMPALTNQLSMRIAIETVEGSLGLPTVLHLQSAFENLFGATTIAVPPEEVYRWLHSASSLPPANRAATLMQFLQLSEPRGNGVELHVCLDVRDIDVVFAADVPRSTAPPAGPLAAAAAPPSVVAGTCVTLHHLDFVVMSQVSYTDMTCTTTPITIRLGTRRVRRGGGGNRGAGGGGGGGWAAYRNGGARSAAGHLTKSVSSADVLGDRQPPPTSTASSPRGGAGPSTDPLDYSRRSSLNETQNFYSDSSGVPPIYQQQRGATNLHHPAQKFPTKQQRVGVGSEAQWCQLDDQYLCVGPITFSRVSHFGPPPHRTRFHGVVEASIGSISCYMSAETLTVMVAELFGALQQAKAEDPVRSEAMQQAKADAEASHEAAQLAMLDARGGGSSHRGTHSRTKSISQDALDRPYLVSPLLPPHQQRRGGGRVHQYRCSIVLDISESTQNAFEQFIEDQQQSLDDSVDFGVFCVAAGCDDVRISVVFPDVGLCHVRLPEGIHMASSTLNDTNSNKRLSAKVPYITVSLLLPKASTQLPSADIVGDLVEAARLATSVSARETIAYPFDGQHGVLGHFAQQVEFVKLCDYDHRVALSLNSIFPRQATASAASAVAAARRNNTNGGGIFAQTSATNYETDSMFQGQSSAASIVPDDVVRPRRGARRLTAAELSSIPIPNMSSSSAFTAAVERFEQRQLVNNTPRSAEVSAVSESDSELHSLDEAAAAEVASPGRTTQNSKAFWTCGSELSATGGGGHAEDAGELENLTDLFSEPGSRTNSNDGDTADATHLEDDEEAAGGGVGVGGSGGALRPVLDYYRCHRTFEVHRSHRTLSNYSHTALLPQVRTDGSQQRDYSNFHAHLPSVEFILHASSPLTAAGQPPSTATSPSRRASAANLEGGGHERSAPQASPYSFAQDFNEYDAERGSADGGPPLEWANRTVDNNRRSRDGSTTTHYHIETPLALEVFGSIEGVRAAICCGSMTNHLWADAMGRMDGTVRESAGALGPIPETREGGDNLLSAPSSATRPRRKKQVSRSRKRNRLKQWSHKDHIVSLCIPCIEAKWLSRAAVGDDVLVRPRDPRTCVGVYTTTIAARSLQLVAQKSAPSRRAALGRETIRHGLSIGASTVAVMVQINYEPTLRVGSLNVDIPLVVYPKHADYVAVAYVTNATLRGKRDYIGENQGTGCRASMESCVAHTTRDVFHFINTLDVDTSTTPLGRQPPPPPPPAARQQGGGGGQRSELRLLESSDDEDFGSSGEPQRNAAPTAARTSGSSTHNVLHTLLPRGVFWQLQGVITVQHVIRVELVDVVRSQACLLVGSDRPSVLQLVRPSVNLRIMKPSRLRDAPQPQRVDALVDVQQLRLDLYPSLFHFASAYTSSLKRKPAATFAPFPAATGGGGSAAQGSAASSANTESAIPKTLVTVSVALRALDLLILQSPSNLLQLSGKQWLAAARTQEDTPSPAPTPFIATEEDLSLTAPVQSVKDFRKSFSRRVLMILCKKATRQRQKFYQKTCPPHIVSTVSLTASASLFGESLIMYYSADLADVPLTSNVAQRHQQQQQQQQLGAMAAVPSPAPSVAPSSAKLHRQTNRVVQLLLKDIAVSAHQTKKAADWRCPVPGARQWAVVTSVRGTSLTVPYRPQTADVIHPQMQAWATEWWRAARRYGNMQRPADPLVATQAASAAQVTTTAPPLPPKPAAAIVLQLDVQSIAVHVELPQDSSAKFHIPRMMGLMKSEGPRLLLKANVKPSKLTTRAGTTGNSIIAFPAIICDYGRDSTKSNTTVLLETFEAILDPHVTNHMLMAYEKVVSELIGIIATSTASLSTPPHGGEEGNMSDDDCEEGGGMRSSPSRRSTSHAITALQPPRPRAGPAAVPLRSFVLVGLRNMRVSLVTSMSEARVMFHQLDVSQEVHPASNRSIVLGRCKGLRLALVDRDDYDQHMRDSNNGAAASAGLASRGAPPMSRQSAASDGSSSQRFGGYIWGMVELGVHVKAESKAVKTSPNATRGGHGVNPPHDWSGDAEASALAHGLSGGANTGRKQPTSNFGDGTSPLVRSETSLSSRWGVEVILHTPLIIMRPGVAQHITAALQEANNATTEMRAQAAFDSRRVQMRLHASKAYRKILALKQRWDRDHHNNSKQQQQQQRGGPMTSPPTVPPPQLGAADAHKNRRRNTGSRHPTSTTPTSTTLSSASSPITSAATTHQVASIKRLVVSVQVRHFLVVVPCGEAAFRSILEGRQDMYEQSKVAKGDSLIRQRFVPVMALKFHIRSTAVHWMREEVTTTTSTPLPNVNSSGAYSSFNTTGSATPMMFTPRHERPGMAPRTPSIAQQSAAVHQLTMQSEVSTKGTMKVDELNLFFTDGSRLAPSHLQSKNLSFKTLVLGGIGTLTESDPAVLHTERQSSFDRVHVGRVSLSFSTAKHLPLSVMLVSSEAASTSTTGKQQQHHQPKTRRGGHVDPSRVLLVADGPVQDTDSPTTDGAAAANLTHEHIATTLSISGPEVHCTSRCTAMVSELMADLTSEMIPVGGGSSAHKAPFSPTTAASPTSHAATSPTQVLLDVTAVNAVPIRRSFHAKGILEPGKVILYTLQSNQGGGGGGGGGGGMHRSFRSTLGNRRGVSFTLSPPPHAAGGPNFLDLQHRQVATEAMSVPLPSAVVTIFAERGGGDELPDSANIRVAIAAKRMEVDPAIAILWQEVQLWVKLHQQESRDRAERIYKHVLDFATSRTSGGDGGVAVGQGSDASSDGGAAAAAAAAASAASTSLKKRGGGQKQPQLPTRAVTRLNAMMDAGLPVPRAFATALWFLREQPAAAPTTPQNDSMDSVDRGGAKSPPPPQSPLSSAASRSQKGTNVSVHVNLTGLRLDLSTVNATQPNMRSGSTGGGGGRMAPPDTPSTSSSKGPSNTFAALFTDHDGSLDLIFQQRPPPQTSAAMGRTTTFAGPAAGLDATIPGTTTAPSPLIVVTVTAQRLRFECQNKVEVKSLEMFLPLMVATASFRLVPTLDLVASDIPKQPPPPQPPQQQQQHAAAAASMMKAAASVVPDESFRRVGRNLPPLSLPQSAPPPSFNLPQTSVVVHTELVNIAVHVPSAADDVGGTVHNYYNGGGILGTMTPGPQMTVRAQHLNQLILVATHWQQKWAEARDETARLFRTSAVRRSKRRGGGGHGEAAAASPPQSHKRGGAAGDRSPPPRKPSPPFLRRPRAASLLPAAASSIQFNTSFAPNHNTLSNATAAPPPRLPAVVRQWVVNVGRSTSWLDLGGGNKHEFSIGSLRSTGRQVMYHTMDTLIDGSALLLDCRIRSDGVLSGANSIARVSMRGFMLLPPDPADVDMLNAIEQFERSSKQQGTGHHHQQVREGSFTPASSAAAGSGEVPNTSSHHQRPPPTSFDHVMRSTNGRTKRILINVDDVNIHFKERQIRDVALFSIDGLRIDAKDVYDTGTTDGNGHSTGNAQDVAADVSTTTGAPPSRSTRSAPSPNHGSPLHHQGTTDGPRAPPPPPPPSPSSHAAAMISVDLERCLIGITPQTTASLLGVAGDVTTILRDQQAVAAANVAVLSAGPKQQSAMQSMSNAVDDFGGTSATNSSLKLLGGAGTDHNGTTTRRGAFPLPPAGSPQRLTQATATQQIPLSRRITSGQVTVTLKYSTIMIGSVIDARHLRSDAATAAAGGGFGGVQDSAQDCVVLRVPAMELVFAQAVLPPTEESINGSVARQPETTTVQQRHSRLSAKGVKDALMGAWSATAGRWTSGTHAASASAQPPGAASAHSAQTPSRELFGGHATPAATSPNAHLPGDEITTANQRAEALAAASVERATVRKMLILSVENVELTRLHGNDRVVILGFRGNNIVELFAEQSLHFPLLTPPAVMAGLPAGLVTRHNDAHGVVHLEVPYSVLLRQTHPWTGSPRFEDFQAMLDVVRTFTHPPNVVALDDFALLRRNMNFHQQQQYQMAGAVQHQPPSAQSSSAAAAAAALRGSDEQQHDEQLPAVAVTIDYSFHALDARQVRFAPQLRFGRDVSVSLETILSWIGTQEEMIPRRLFLNVCRPMESLMAVVEGCTSTEQLATHFGEDAIRAGAATTDPLS